MFGWTGSWSKISVMQSLIDDLKKSNVYLRHQYDAAINDNIRLRTENHRLIDLKESIILALKEYEPCESTDESC